jgi:hypothetical protein
MTQRETTLMLIIVGLVSMIAGAGAYTVYHVTRSSEPSPPSMNKVFKPEDMETYKAALPTVQAFKAQPACAGEGATAAVAKLAELKEDAKIMGPVAGITGLEPADYLRLHITLALDFADAARAAGCLDLAEQQYRDLLATYNTPDDAATAAQAQAGLTKVLELRSAGTPPAKAP